MAATNRQREDEWRVKVLAAEKAYVASFRAHLRTETARTVPDPIFIAALIGTARLRHVALPDEAWGVPAPMSATGSSKRRSAITTARVAGGYRLSDCEDRLIEISSDRDPDALLIARRRLPG